MGIIEFTIIAALLGLFAWAVTTYVPMPGPIKKVIVIAVVVVVVALLLSAMGIIGRDVAIPRVR